MYAIIALMCCALLAGLYGLYNRIKTSPKRFLHFLDLLTIILVAIMFKMSLHDMPGNIFDDSCVSPGNTAIKTMLWSLYMFNTML